MASFELDAIDQVSTKPTYLVPINITYYPLRVQENMISALLKKAIDDLSERSIEEMMTEGVMLLSGVDVDI